MNLNLSSETVAWLQAQVESGHFASYEDAIDYSVRAQSRDAYEIDVTGCRYAQFYKELGEPELGFLLVCGLDFPFAEGLGPDIKLTRTQTIMQGASHCDFDYTFDKDGDKDAKP